MAIPRTKTDLDNYLVYGIDEKHRRIFFGHPLADDIMDDVDPNEFTDISVELAVRAIKRMEKDHPKKPIELYMSSCGGDMNAALYLKDIILSSTCQFKFYGGGKVRSSATIIMAICDERNLYPDAEIMVHDGDSEKAAKTTDGEIDAEENRRLQDLLEKLYADNSRMPKSFWTTVCKRDCYITSEEAVTFGLADRIIHPKKRGNFRKIRQAHLNTKIDGRRMQRLVKKIYSRIKIDVKLKDININPPIVEPIDNNLIIDNSPVVANEEKETMVSEENQTQ